MPEKFWNRMNTIQNTQPDASMHGRIVAWQVAYKYANDHFPFGAGFYAPQLASIFNSYFPMEETHAAHSIYFQVLGEQGYIGLTIYLMIIAGAFWSSCPHHTHCPRTRGACMGWQPRHDDSTKSNSLLRRWSCAEHGLL